MKRLQWVRRLAWAIVALAAVVGLFAWLYWPETRILIREREEAFKLVGYALGPLIAIAGFLWGLSEKAELRDQSEVLGAARNQAKAEADRAAKALAAVAVKEEKIKVLERDLQTIADSRRLWQMRSNAPFTEYKGWKYDPEGAKIVTVALFKGGVGKTHMSANFAAYVSEKQKKPVLLIDLDYQGSLSSTVLNAAGIEMPPSAVDALFHEAADLATIMEKRIHLSSRGAGVALNGGRGLPQAWIIPADYTLTAVESQMLIDRAINPRSALDERYRLAHVLLNPQVRRDYAMIIIDTPPRMTLGTVNALVASHAYVVPTILDRVSGEAIEPFLAQIEGLGGIKRDLDLDLKLAGIVGTLTRNLPLDDQEKRAMSQINATVREYLGAEAEPFVPQNLPRKKIINDSDDIGYFLNDSVGPLRERFYDAIFDELWERIHGRHTIAPESQ